MALAYAQFIKNVGDKQFMKCLNNNMNHCGFQYERKLLNKMV